MTDDELLAPKPVAANQPLRDAIFARCSGEVRWRRRGRILSRSAVCLACFACGVATNWLQSEPEPRVVLRHVPADIEPPKPKEIPKPALQLSPSELELEAEKTLVRAESAKLFRQAGDRYVLDLADYRAALRCYRNFLDDADLDELNVSADDTWLLTSLKRARKLETNP